MGEFKTEVSAMQKKEEPEDTELKKEPKVDDSDSEKKSEEPASAEKFYSRTSSVQDLR